MTMLTYGASDGALSVDIGIVEISNFCKYFCESQRHPLGAIDAHSVSY